MTPTPRLWVQVVLVEFTVSGGGGTPTGDVTITVAGGLGNLYRHPRRAVLGPARFF